MMLTVGLFMTIRGEAKLAGVGTDMGFLPPGSKGFTHLIPGLRSS